MCCTVRAPVFRRHQFFGTSEHYGKAHGSLLSGWMNYNYTACCWFPTSSNNLILPLSQFWQIRFGSCWLHCSKCGILVIAFTVPVMCTCACFHLISLGVLVFNDRNKRVRYFICACVSWASFEINKPSQLLRSRRKNTSFVAKPRNVFVNSMFIPNDLWNIPWFFAHCEIPNSPTVNAEIFAVH